MWALVVVLSACSSDTPGTGGDGNGLPKDAAVDGDSLTHVDGPVVDVPSSCPGQECGPSKVCCPGDQVCYGDKCVPKGSPCQLHSDCSYDAFCDPLLHVCLTQDLAFCQYRPPVGDFNPKSEWTWTGTATAMPDHVDVTHPALVLHLTDDNKDGKLGPGDVPSVVVITYLDKVTNPFMDGVLRALRGDTGVELWSVTDPANRLNADVMPAAADINGDGFPEIVALDKDQFLKAFDRTGKLLWTSTTKACYDRGISIADLDADGVPEIFSCATVFDNKGVLKWTAASGARMTTAANVDGDAKGTLEIVTGDRTYTHDGKLLWQQTAVTAGYPAVADFFGDGDPDVVLVTQGKVYILDGKTGKIEWGPQALPIPTGGDPTKAGPGGPPTVADFDGDGKPEIGVAGGYYYVVFDPDGPKPVLWKQATKDLSSRITGSSVFDFEGDGKAEVVYADECFLRVYDGTTGKVLFSRSTSSRTRTEYPVVADVDGDGRAEIVMVHNKYVVGCETLPGWVTPPGGVYRGVTVFGDAKDNWVGTRRIWNQHGYHVSNVCNGSDQACPSAQNTYSVVPSPEKANWKIPWLNSFRQNAQGFGLFNTADLVAPATTQELCTNAIVVDVEVRNQGSAPASAGTSVTLYVKDPTSGYKALQTVKTTKTLLPGQSEIVKFSVPTPGEYQGKTIELQVVVDDDGTGAGGLNECDETNNTLTLQLTCSTIG